MVAQPLKCIFLSASIPIPGRDDDKYLNTSDDIAIRDAVIALASVALPKFHLVWGGHPSITPLIVSVLKHLDISINDHITLYQSKYYENKFPSENNDIGNIVLTEKGRDSCESLKIMREQMLGDHEFVAGFFIGGMDGVEEEFKIFKDIHPDALLIPVASTGGAAKVIYEQGKTEFGLELETDLAYFSIFRDVLQNIK